MSVICRADSEMLQRRRRRMNTMSRITNRAQNISESLTLAITAKAKKMKADGIAVIGFGAGEPDFNTPDYIINAAKVALDKGLTKYTASSGMPELKAAIADKFLNDNGLSYSPAQIVVSNGAKHSLYNAMLAIVEEGDEVIIPAPYWLTYPELVKLCGGVPVIAYPGDKVSLKVTAEDIYKVATDKTKAIVINSPSNPSGIVYSEDELKALSEAIEKLGLITISDEIYEKLIYDGMDHYSIAASSDYMYNNTIVINGASKSYSMTGWRIGYLAAPKDIAAAIDCMQSHCTSNANSIAQYATIAALKEAGDFLPNMVKSFDARRRLMTALIGEIKGLDYIDPKGAFYVMVNVSALFGRESGGRKLTCAQDVAEVLLDKAYVAVVPCESFGADEYIRLSYAISESDIREGIARISSFVSGILG